MEAIVYATRGEQLLQVVQECPGLTAREYAELLDWSPNWAYQECHRLVGDGRLVIVGGKRRSSVNPCRYGLAPEPTRLTQREVAGPKLPALRTIMRMVLDAVSADPGHKYKVYAAKLWVGGGDPPIKVYRQVSGAVNGLRERGLVEPVEADADKRRHYRIQVSDVGAELLRGAPVQVRGRVALQVVPDSDPDPIGVALEPPVKPVFAAEMAALREECSRLMQERDRIQARIDKITVAIEVLEEL